GSTENPEIAGEPLFVPGPTPKSKHTEEINMTTQVNKTGKSPHPLAWVAGIALILFCVAGIAAIMGWIPTSIGGGSGVEPPAKKAAQPVARAKAPPAQVASSAPVAKCSNCG